MKTFCFVKLNKPDNISYVLFAFIFIFNFGGASALFAAKKADNTNKEAVIIEHRGDVTIKSAKSSREVPVKTGQSVYPGDTIKTGSNGRVVILLSNGNRLDIFSNSQVRIKDKNENSKESLVGKYWRKLKSKFDDAEYTSNTTGRVGALRGKPGAKQPPPSDEELADSDKKALQISTKEIESEELSPKTSRLMKAVLFEEYGQYKSAEVIYIELIKEFPEDKVIYDMLIDLYINIDLADRANDILEKKNNLK
ncbi:MAG: hypothetical protein ABUK01_07815 [Leptospirales bacterium]